MFLAQFSYYCSYDLNRNSVIPMKTLAPEWKAAAEVFNPDTDDVILAAVDATLSPKLTAR